MLWIWPVPMNWQKGWIKRDKMKLNKICIFFRVSEALIYGAWMLGQGLAFVPNYSIAKMAAGRMFRIMDRKPQIHSSQMMGSCAWVSYIFSSLYTRGYSEMPFSVPWFNIHPLLTSNFNNPKSTISVLMFLSSV